MKKLIITLEYPPVSGGVSVYVEQFVHSLTKDEVVVLAPVQSGKGEMVTETERLGYEIRRRKLFFPIFIWPRWLKMVGLVWNLVKKQKIEMVYLHHVLPVGYVAWLVGKITKVPFVVFSHGTDLEYATRSRWKRHWLRLVIGSAVQVVFNSENLRQRFLKFFPEWADKTTVLYPCPGINFLAGVDPQKVTALRNQYALLGKKVILTVSRLDDGKGLTHLVRIMPQILAQEPNLVWIIIGDGPKQKYLLEEIQKQSLQNVVRYLGARPHEDLPLFYALADLFVLLTHPDEGREEGLGLVFLEAAAAGIPAVAGRSGGVEEAVISGQTGVVVDIYQGDTKVVKAITDLLRRPEYGRELGKRARERVLADFRWENQLQNIARWR
ncbi:MAG TPA: glycosyltransferase family 4 protein [Patescibacteria group bacterium]|nr:glycosyltransferase family 4 protein [Patescibacteria group bacterium]